MMTDVGPAWLAALSGLVGACLAGVPALLTGAVAIYQARQAVRRDEVELLRSMLDDMAVALRDARTEAEASRAARDREVADLRRQLTRLQDEIGYLERCLDEVEAVLSREGIPMPETLRRRRRGDRVSEATEGDS